MTTTATAETLPAQPPEAESWKQKFEREWLQTKLAFEGMMLAKINKQNAEVFKLAGMARTGKFETTSSGGTSPEEDMGVSIGNTYHFEAKPVSSDTTTTTQAKTAGLGKAATAALIGASLLGGPITGAATAYFLNRDPAVVEQAAGEIAEYEAGFVPVDDTGKFINQNPK